jgi:membrane-associated protease RseP (regulator of RpoE activity)
VTWQGFDLYDWLTVYVLLLALPAAYALAQVFVGTWLGLGVREVRFGSGPAVLKRRVMGGEWSLRLLPLGSSVEFIGDVPEIPPPPGARSVRDLRFAPFALLALAGPVTTAFLGAAIYAVNGPPSVRLPAALGVYLGLINLLPVPPLNGGQILLKGIESARGRPIPEMTRTLITMIGLLLTLALGVWFLYTLTFHPTAILRFYFPFSVADA